MSKITMAAAAAAGYVLGARAGRERYDEWLFVVGQVPVVVGKAAQLPGTAPATLPGGTRGRRAPNQLPGPNSPRGRQRPRPGER